MGNQSFDASRLRYPVKHRRQVPFGPSIVVPPDFRNRAEHLRHLDARLGGYYLRPADYFELVNEAFAVNVHRSIELEGSPLTEDEVRESSRRLLAAPRPVDAMPLPMQEVFTHLALWLSPAESRAPWSLAKILTLHRILLLGDEHAQPGKLRGDEPGGYGVYTDRHQLVFEPCPGRHVAAELEDLLRWRNEMAPGLQAICAATAFYHAFESIHPFEDGNGRLGRILFHHLLHDGGLRNAHLCLIEPQLLGDRERYYALLAWADQEGDYTPLIDHFTTGIARAYETADRTWRSKDLLSSELDEVDVALVKGARHHRDPFAVREAVDWVVGRSEQTVRLRLNRLVDDGIMESGGRTVAKKYRLVDPLRSFMQHVQGLLGEAAPPNEEPRRPMEAPRRARGL